MYANTDQRGQQKLAIALELVPNTPVLPVGEYSLIVADPPWSYHLRETDRSHRGRCPYPSMSDEQIKAMPVQAIAAENAYLLLWTTNNHLSLAFEVAKAWGFEYKALHTWVKTTIAGDKIRFGIGHYGRNCTGFDGRANSFSRTAESPFRETRSVLHNGGAVRFSSWRSENGAVLKMRSPWLAELGGGSIERMADVHEPKT
jgi:hypothetical protein